MTTPISHLRAAETDFHNRVYGDGPMDLQVFISVRRGWA